MTLSSCIGAKSVIVLEIPLPVCAKDNSMPNAILQCLTAYRTEFSIFAIVNGFNKNLTT